MIHKLYNNKVWIDYEDDGHVYLVTDKEKGKDAEKAVSVTAITGIVDKPYLRFWTVKMMHTYLSTKWEAGRVYDEIEIQTLLDEGKRAHTVKLKEAGNIGTLTHAWCESLIKSQIAGDMKVPPFPHNEQSKNGCMTFLRWVSENDVRFVLSEQKVYSRKHGYVGTLDFTARFGKAKALIMGDLKTSNTFDPQMFWQISGYQLARQEEHPKEKYKKQVLVRCGKDGALEVVENNDFKKDAQAFLNCLGVYRRLQEIK